MKVLRYYLLALFIIIFDQLTKLFVYFNMDMGLIGEIKIIGNWLKFHYTLNPGMAFGMELGFDNGKLFLSLFRLIAVTAIGFYLYTMIQKKQPNGLLICVAMILGGAIGNVVDSTFYGVFLNNAPSGSPSLWFHGQVIDMIYIDIWEGFLPDIIPIIGGQYYSFWPIFNIADSSIFLGVLFILINQKKWLKA